MSREKLKSCDLEALESAVGGSAAWLAQAQSAIFGEPKPYKPEQAAASPEPEPDPMAGLLGSMGGGNPMGSMMGGGGQNGANG